jgi:CBS domain containing-hemolysin-like protein
MKSVWSIPAALLLLLLATPAAAATVGDGGAVVEGSVTLLVVYVAVALVFSFACSIAESVLLSLSPSYIEGLREQHPARAQALQRLRVDNVDRSLAAILTLNTIAHTAGAIGAGAQAAAVFGSAVTGVFSAGMTLAILFLSEIVPKTLGTVYWRNLIPPVASFIRTLIIVLFPLVVVSEWLTRLIARGRDVEAVNRQEFIAMAGVAEEAGHIDVHESRIFRNLFRFETLTAEDAMTPRTVLVALPQAMTVSEALGEAEQIPFSRLPVYGKDIDDVTGFVLKDEMLMYEARDQGDTRLEEIRREMRTVPQDTPLSKLLESLLENKQHIAIVEDRYGGTDGLVTLEDVVETLLGMEIVDEMDDVEDMQALARGLAEKRAEKFRRRSEEWERASEAEADSGAVSDSETDPGDEEPVPNPAAKPLDADR